MEAKTTRIDLRVNKKDKEILETAAYLNRTSLSSYILSVAINAAKMDLEKEEILILSNEQRDKIIQLLDNPPEPNEELRALLND